MIIEMERDYEEQGTAWIQTHPNPSLEQIAVFRENYVALALSKKLDWAREDNVQYYPGGTKYDSGNVEFITNLQKEVAADHDFMYAMVAGDSKRQATNDAVRKRLDANVRWLSAKIGAGQIISDNGELYFKTANDVYSITTPAKNTMVVFNSKGDEVYRYPPKKEDKPPAVTKPSTILDPAASGGFIPVPIPGQWTPFMTPAKPESSGGSH
jgi:hypothetical protein